MAFSPSEMIYFSLLMNKTRAISEAPYRMLKRNNNNKKKNHIISEKWLCNVAQEAWNVELR